MTRVKEINSVARNRWIKFYHGSAYILGVHYDGAIGAAVIELLDEKGENLYLLVDPTGHKPYFLTDISPEEAREILRRESSVDEITEVTKINPLNMDNVRMTKIITKDPMSVANLRDKVSRSWESKIKYHDNYVFDNQLIPGMRYRLEHINGAYKFVIQRPSISEETIKKIEEIFRGESQETLKLAYEWINLFEEPPPHARRVAFDIEVFTPFRGRIPNPNTAEYPVISVAFIANDGLKKVFLLAKEGRWGSISEDFPEDAEIEFFDSEAALILETIRLLSGYPIVLSFNGDSFDLNYLHNRAVRLGIPEEFLHIKYGEDKVKIDTNIHLDLYKFFKNRAIKSYAFGGRYTEEKLDTIATALLGISKIKVEGNIGELNYADLISYNYRDAELTLRLTTFNDELVWKLMILLARIAKVSLEDICRRSISKWIQNQFYWEHRRRNYLIPNPEDIKRHSRSSGTRAVIEGKKYAGALVIEPPKGVFFDVTVLDVASLYPSIIKRYNLSYETVDFEKCRPGRRVGIRDETGREIHYVCIERPGLTAQITGLLRDYRVGLYKKKAKDKSLPPEQRTWYDVVQRAMKVFINASYGVFGAENFPLYSPAVAESVTALGRKSLYSILKKVAEIGIKVLYGDTDSIFLWAPTKEQLEKMQEWVSKNLGLEIDVDKEFDYVLFTGLKKNYVGRYRGGGIEIKGLVAKKRNTPEFLKELVAELIDKLEKAKTPEDFKELMEWLEGEVRTLYRDLKRKNITLDRLAFKVNLTKSIKEYTKNRPPHVKAALQLMRHGVAVEAGDIIIYVKVKSKDGYKAIQLTKLYEIDPDKYIEIIDNALSQLLSALGVESDEIKGLKKLTPFSFT